MTGIVVDASVALAWCFPDEDTAYADRVLEALEGQGMVVPSIWALEVANAMIVAERRKRIGKPEIGRFVALLGNLTITEMAVPVGGILEHVVPLAREHGLSAYDAAYLDVALRSGLALATADGPLGTAARKVGIPIWPARKGGKAPR